LIIIKRASTSIKKAVTKEGVEGVVRKEELHNYIA
jgi:hypothetical protein